MGLTDKVEIPRRVMTLFFMVDTSGSMDGKKIGAVNTAIEEVIPAIREVSAENADAEIKVAALEFSSGAQWLTPDGPVEVDQFNWNDLKAAGVTDFGDACKALNEKLSTKAFMKEATGSFAPAIFLLSDGDPTDDYKKSLDVLKQNNWFKAAVKVAVAIGDEANKEVLKEFTGSIESVLEAHNVAALKKMIKFVSVTASQVASKSTNAGDVDGGEVSDDQKQKEVEAALADLKEEVAQEPENDQDDW
jgi:uncharacterized protein YegL